MEYDYGHNIQGYRCRFLGYVTTLAEVMDVSMKIMSGATCLTN